MPLPDLRSFLHILSVLYALVTLWLAAYGLHSWTLLVLYWWHRKRTRGTSVGPPLPSCAEWPVVTVQLPLYNERHVARRLIDAVAALDYPRDRLEIQVLDDSTDGTTAIAQARAAFWQARGVDIRVLHRPHRTGFKAGALAWGLQHARGELIAVFDADFCPHPDFLQRVVPEFLADPQLGMVQTRWSHLNAEYSLITRAQAIALDGHFVVEQIARSQTGLLMHFNGSGGVWRRSCIEQSGGWQSDTLCEDLDLSYRAQLAGWRCRFLPDVDCAAELPPQVLAWKQQQARWARGSAQCLRKLARPLLQSPRLNPFQKLMGLLHLSGYLIYPLLILLLILTPITLLVPSPLGAISRLLGPLCLGPILVYGTGQWALYRDWARRLLAFPVLVLIGTGIAWENTQALIQGLTHWGGTFVRTPKFRLDGRRGNWHRSGYRLKEDRAVGWEIALSLYALSSAVWAWAAGRGDVLPFLLIYAVAFGLVAGISLYEMGQGTLRTFRRPDRIPGELRSH